MEKKNFGTYLKGVYKGCNFVACIVLAILVGVLICLGEYSGAFEKIANLKIDRLLLIIVPAGLGVIALAYAVIKSALKKEIGIADFVAVTGVALSIVLLVLSLMAINSATFLGKIMAFAVAVVVTAVIVLIRAIFSDGTVKINYDDVPPANSTIKTYYKAFFKKYLVYAIVFAVVSVVGIILMDKANFATTLFNKKNAQLTYSVIALVAVLFLSLYVARIKDRDIDFVDVLLFIMMIAGVAILVISLFVGATNKVIVGAFGGATLIVSALLSLIASKNTHIETKAEKDDYAHAKAGFKAYFSSLKNHVNLVVLIAVSLIIASVFATLLLTNTASSLINGLKLANRKEFTYAVFAVAVFVFALAYTDVTLHRAETIDLIMVATFITSIFALVVDQLVMKQTFIVGGLMFTVVAVISLAFILLRTRFVKVLHQADVEEIAVQAPVELKEQPIEVDSNEQPAVIAEEETVATQSPELVVEEEEIPVKLKRVNVKKSFEVYLRTGDEQVKDNYSQIKNELLSYGIHSRYTQMRENFSKKGLTMSRVKPEKNLRLQAKLLIRGKFLKLYLNVDPSVVDAKYFRTKDVSSKMPDQPTYIKVRSKLSLKRALELIQLLAEKEGFKKKKKFEPIDYKAELTDENLSYMQKLGYDYMVKDSVTYQEVLQYREDWAERVVKTKIIPDAERYIYDEISLKYIEKEYNDGDVVDLESLRAKNLIKINCNHLTVTASETLSKKLYISANAIDNKTAQMVIIAGGEVTRLVFD